MTSLCILYCNGSKIHKIEHFPVVWNCSGVVMISTLSSLVFTMTTAYGATCDVKVGIMTSLVFQCIHPVLWVDLMCVSPGYLRPSHRDHGHPSAALGPARHVLHRQGVVRIWTTQRGLVRYRISPLKLIFNWNLTKSRSPITSISVFKSSWNSARSTAVILPCSVQNCKTILWLRNALCTNEISWDLGHARISHITTAPVTNELPSAHESQPHISCSLLISCGNWLHFRRKNIIMKCHLDIFGIAARRVSFHMKRVGYAELWCQHTGVNCQGPFWLKKFTRHLDHH